MKITAITLAATLLVSTAHAEEAFTPAHMVKSENECTTTDVVIGAGATVVVAVGVGVVAVASLPITTASGAIVAGGATVGVSAATTTFLAGATLPAIAGASAVMAPTVGTITYYASCVLGE